MKDDQDASRLMCFALRHKPEAFGLVLDVHGWVDISVLAKALDIPGVSIRRIAAKDQKGRYELRAHHTQIRCAQGHSTPQVNLEFEAVQPPEVLYHGTKRHFLDNIFKEGLTPQSRHYVHLSQDEDTAISVAGRRKGTQAIITIKAAEMYAAGLTLYRSTNGVWLCKHVPPEYLGPIKYDTASDWTSRN